ncbi:MAG: PspC domain-containing protein, partial [Bacteroidetes bacterium]
MNKTVNINLSGIIFHIEEDAYGKLHSYLSTIKGYFSESEGRDEIMSDIENRIAEMLSEKVSDKKQVVLMADVDRVIEVMGKPEDFAGEQIKGEETKREQPIYSSTNKRRRVFRDPDNKILGGVCSGIANYFNIDPLWLRLALVISFFAFGTGFLLYIVLWIVIPEAKTAAEKLEMRGEDVNFSNIGKKVEEELHTFGKKVENWGSEVKNGHAVNKGKDFIGKFFDFLGSVLGGFLRVFLKLLGIFLAILGMILLVGMISSLFGGTGFVHIGGETFSIRDGYSMLLESQQQEWLASITILLFIGVPVIMLVYGGIKMLLGIKTKNKFVGIGAVVLWLCGLLLAIVLGNQVAGQFSHAETSKYIFPLSHPKCDTLFLKVKGDVDFGYEHKRWGKHMRVRVNHHDVLSSDSVNINFGFPELDIVRGETENFEIIVYGESNGKDRKEALHLARNIIYSISQSDSIVEFSPCFSVPKDEKWRAQQLHVEVRVPKGKMV